MNQVEAVVSHRLAFQHGFTMLATDIRNIFLGPFKFAHLYRRRTEIMRARALLAFLDSTDGNRELLSSHRAQARATAYQILMGNEEESI